MGVYPDEIRQENGRHRKRNLTGRMPAVYGHLKSFTDKFKTFKMALWKGKSLVNPILKAAHGCTSGRNDKKVAGDSKVEIVE